jgi:ribose 5-phosphate isomerase B
VQKQKENDITRMKRMNQFKKICIGCDHAAVELKDKLVVYLKDKNLQIHDMGTNNPDKSVNYPEFGMRVALSVVNEAYDCGILICGTGLGMSMVANRFAGIRAALCNDIFAAKMSRQHNNANILVLGGRILGDVLAKEIVQTFLETTFDGGRHADRLNIFDHLGETIN